MGKLNKKYFWYGAIITAIMQNNPDASPILILNDEDTRQAYRITTNNSKQDCILFLKYASCCNEKRSNKYYSWRFVFSESDLQNLKEYKEKKLPVFICCLCLRDNLRESEIAIIKYEEFDQVKNNQSITIGLENRKHDFYLFSGTSKSRSNARLISRNRIKCQFDDLAEETVKGTKCNYQKQNRDVTIIDKDLIPDGIKEYENSSLCPICGEILEQTFVGQHVAKTCPYCKAIYLSKTSYSCICTQFNVQHLKPRVHIMDFEEINTNKDDENITAIKSSNLIYILEDDNIHCPIHKNKMILTTIDFGHQMFDITYYCPQCDQKYMTRKSYENIEKMINIKKSKVNFKFRDFNYKV